MSMFEHKEIHSLDDFFLKLSSRSDKRVFFYRINEYSIEVENFIKKYYNSARINGVVIEGRIQNPTEDNLNYYSEIMGLDFQLGIGFIGDSLKKWLPRMDAMQRENVCICMYEFLLNMKKNGKNDNMLKNAYIKFMCWLYYKFERIVNKLGNEDIPKILYEGNVSNYELMFLTILSNAGCDIVLIQYSGDKDYKKLDALSEKSNELVIQNATAFPEDFSLKNLQNKILEEQKTKRLYGTESSVINCTNAWCSGKILDDIRTAVANRGNDSKLFYNCFCVMNGVEDKLTYANELYQLQLEIKNNKRNLVIENGKIPEPTYEEIKLINRGNYKNKEQLISHITKNIQYGLDSKLEKILIKSFVDIILSEAKNDENHISRLTNKAVILLCWLKRYIPVLFNKWKFPEVSCFFLLSDGDKSLYEDLFFRLLARTPVDVVIFNPNLNVKYSIEDSLVYEVNNMESLNISIFPQDNTDLRIGTAAYHAERELDTLMYQNTGIYRNQQFMQATSVNLQTMYEEIEILWNEEIKYRPNFSVVDNMVNMPVIFSKISGVKDGDVNQYWNSIKKLYVDNCELVSKVPFIDSLSYNPVKQYATTFLKNKRIQKNIIKEHKCYQYSYLRDNVQDYILEKLQTLLDEQIIKGTYENGTEYTIISTVLNMPKEILRLIQKFDFTKKNPKLVYINSGEKGISLEDSILIAFLNLLGFDIVFFVPTGYQTVEKHFNKLNLEEHQIGEYKYDLKIPSITRCDNEFSPRSWKEKIFGRF